MSNHNYTNTINVSISAENAFTAILEEMSKWWTEMTSTLKKIGDKTTAKFEDGTAWSFELINLEHNKLIELICYEANHIHSASSEAMRTEWLNTVLKFEIEETTNYTEITFTHIGLTPKKYCFEICKSGWDHFFGEGFRTYLEQKYAI